MIHKAKKSLGQNFLINPKVAERIAAEADISKKDTVLEIGPGTGNLTKFLLARAKKVIAVEKDDKLFSALQEKFAEQIKSRSLVLVHDDILDFNMKNVLRNYKIVANIPYNITGAILKKFLAGKNKPESMILMVQKEVAERIIARDGKESLLSISVKTYGQPKILFKVGRGNFYPPPEVDSAVLAIKNISGKIFMTPPFPLPLSREGLGRGEERFWEIVRAGFAHKRKKLSSNLKIYDPLLISPTPPDLPLSGEANGFPLIRGKTRGFAGGEKAPMTRGVRDLGNKRAEDLTLEEWFHLVKLLSALR